MPDKSTVKSLLEKLDLGNSVAESDAALDRYFVETQAFKDLVGDKGDVIAGDKGTGKTAMFRILLSRFATLEALKKVEVVAAFNPVGSPVFQRLAQVEVMEEGEYVGLWKTYIFSLVGNWILDLYTDVYTDRMRELEQLLNRTGLNTADDAPETVFSQIMNRLRDLVPSAAEVGVSATPQGILVITPRVEFRKGEEAKPHPQEHVPYEAALGLVNEILREEDLVIWLVMDRLDEAFQGFPKVEIPALRALLRTYLDLQAYPKIRLKLFLRKICSARSPKADLSTLRTSTIGRSISSGRTMTSSCSLVAASARTRSSSRISLWPTTTWTGCFTPCSRARLMPVIGVRRHGIGF